MLIVTIIVIEPLGSAFGSGVQDSRLIGVDALSCSGVESLNHLDSGINLAVTIFSRGSDRGVIDINVRGGAWRLLLDGVHAHDHESIDVVDGEGASLGDAITSGVAVRVTIADLEIPVGLTMKSEAWLDNARGGSHGQKEVVHNIPVDAIKTFGAVQEKASDAVSMVVALLPHGG